MSQESTSFTEVVSQLTQCGVVAVDPERHVLAFNPAAELLTGLKAADGLSLDALPTALRGLLSETLLNGNALRQPQLPLQTAFGTTVTASVSTWPITGGDGTVRGAVAVLHDLSAAARLNQSLRRLDQLASIGTLSASMAHEIKNALVAIKTFVDLLLQQNQPGELAEIARRELRRVEVLVSQMLKFAGPAKPTFSPIHVSEVMDQALELLQIQLEGRKVRLTKSYEAGLARVRGDAYQLGQAFLNLILNAIEAMGPSGQLHVATDLVADDAEAARPAPGARWLRVRIQDTGTGVLPEHRERLFEPFFTTKPQGTGLGLSITRRIVQEHAGSITFESELNQGTTFSIRLPLAASAQ